MYTNYNICPKQIDGVDTEIRYGIACTRCEHRGLVKFTLCYEAEKEQRAAIRRAKATLKEQKRAGHIRLYLSSEDFGLQSTEMEYLKNKYPGIDSDEALTASAFPYFLVGIGAME